MSGILLKTHFEDGALVQEGQLLFSIDAREYRAQVNNARAQVASAEANLYRALQDVARYKPLLADEAIARQVYDNAVAAASQAQAQVDASRAALQESQLGLDYAEVRAPMHGRIGAAQVFPGGLVTAGQTVLATISSDDPAWVYFTIGTARSLLPDRGRRRRQSRNAPRGARPALRQPPGNPVGSRGRRSRGGRRHPEGPPWHTAESSARQARGI
ncbi:MAG: efflux RND transporter periplasmic adaptor subunit [Proteobacteria bacterium]|nr:efflux RND transporter periplasmic adaptor subunit [Pseudomonadota bacterium]